MNREKKTEEVAKGAVKLAPSILAADFTRLGEQVAHAEFSQATRHLRRLGKVASDHVAAVAKGVLARCQGAR